MIEATIIILVLLLIAGGWLSYGITLRLVNQRDTEKERYKKALELAHVRAQEEIKAISADAEQAYAQGKQEGKRITLDWIKKQVDEGTLEVKVVGTPVQPPQAQ